MFYWALNEYSGEQDEWIVTYLQTWQAEPFSEDMIEVSVRLSMTFSLKVATVTGGNPATRRFMLYLWWSER